MKTLSIVIPVYNEENRIDKTFKALSKMQLPAGLCMEAIYFVNDGSSDATKTKITHFANTFTTYPIKLVSYKQNKGKGYAVKTGMLASNADYTLFFDADMSTPLSELKKFMPFIFVDVPIIIGTRKNGQSTVIRHQPLYREILGKGFTYLSNTILNTWVTDFTCGFKAFSRDAKNDIFSRMRVHHWGFDPESLFLGRLLGYEIVETAVVWSDDRRSRVNIWKDLPRSFFELCLIRASQVQGLYDGIKPFWIAKPAFSALRAMAAFMF